MPPNINARIKTLRTALFNHIGFILVKKKKKEREYIITVGVKNKHQNDNDGKKKKTCTIRLYLITVFCFYFQKLVFGNINKKQIFCIFEIKNVFG